MSWSLQIENGDLQIGTSGLNTVSGASKLVQDLSCDLLEPMGTDPLHPTYGSTIDGGIDQNGNYVQSSIGQVNDAATGTMVGTEVLRITQDYQDQQIARNQNDVQIYGKSTLTADEALLEILDVAVEQIDVQALVNVSIQTGTGSLPLTIPFTTSST